MSVDRQRAELRRKFGVDQPRRATVIAVNGSISTDSGLYHVRFPDKSVARYKATGAFVPVAGTPVLVQWSPALQREVIIGEDTNPRAGNTGTNTGNPLDPRNTPPASANSLSELRPTVYGATLTLNVGAVTGRTYYKGDWYTFPGAGVSLADAVPTSADQHRYAVVGWFPPLGKLYVLESTAQSTDDPLGPSDIAQAWATRTRDLIPVAAVPLTTGQAAIAAAAVVDLRQLLNILDFTLASQLDETLAGGTGIDISESSGTVTVAVDSTVALLNAAQTLANKTLTTPTVGDYTNATHDHEDDAGGGSLDAAAIASGILDDSRIRWRAGLCEGRLTLTSGTPVLTANVTGATSLYYTPYAGNTVTLYDGSNWRAYIFTERSLSLSGLSADTNHDVYLYDNTGTLTLEAVAWTNDTTRATALATQDGVYVKSGATARRYLGTFRTTGTSGQTAFTEHLGLVQNYYHRVPRVLFFTNTTSDWTSSVTSYRESNGGVGAVRAEIVTGVREDMVEAVLQCTVSVPDTATDQGGQIGVGVNSTTTATGIRGKVINSAGTTGFIAAPALGVARVLPALGYTYFTGLELSIVGGSITFTSFGETEYGGNVTWRC